MSPAIRTLFILRHAKAEDGDGCRDEDRQLTKRGRRAAERAGELLAERLPDRILSSNAARTRETVERLSKTAHYAGPVEFLDSLYLAEPAAYLAAVRERGRDAERLLLVGHNPGLESLVTRLTGEHVSLPTAALVECTMDVDAWSDVTEETSAELTHVSYPRDD